MRGWTENWVCTTYIITNDCGHGSNCRCALEEVSSWIYFFHFSSSFEGNGNFFIDIFPGWCHKMKTFSALLAFCAGNSPVTGEFPAQRPVTRSFDVFYDLRLNNGWVNNREAGDLRRHRAHYCDAGRILPIFTDFISHIIVLICLPGQLFPSSRVPLFTNMI